MASPRDPRRKKFEISGDEVGSMPISDPVDEEKVDEDDNAELKIDDTQEKSNASE